MRLLLLLCLAPLPLSGCLALHVAGDVAEGVVRTTGDVVEGVVDDDEKEDKEER